MSDKTYTHMSLKELRAELSFRGIKNNGKKKELVDRLKSLDLMNRKAPVVEAEYHMTLPDNNQYRDITADTELPEITMTVIESYLASSGKKFEQKYKDLYYEKFIRFVRVAKTGENWYFYGSVWAEMRRSVTYRTDVYIGEHSTVMAAQCECGAGQGPTAHCKHVSALLYSLHSIRSTSKMYFEETCTQKLQSFHKAKEYRGSPKKLDSLRDHRLTFDPRPAQYRNQSAYPYHFRSTVLNYCGPKPNIPLRQLYPPANLYAVENDHDYVSSAAENLITDLQLETISKERISEIELMTRDQAASAQWHELRTSRITSSRFGEICKATEKKNINSLLASLISPKHFTSQATTHGTVHELTAKRKYESLYGVSLNDSGLCVSPTHPYLAASPDGLVDDGLVIEIKCPFKTRNCKIVPGTPPFLVDDGLKKTHDYYYQVQGQMFCTGRTEAHFCVYTFADFKVFVVPRDQVFIDTMVAKLSDFYTKYFKPALIEARVFKSLSKYYN